MISNALRTDIELWVSRASQNPLLAMAERGELTQAMVTRYIANLTQMIRLTPEHLVRARDGANQRGDSRLAAHFEHKLEEEIGHAVWGENDLAELSAPADMGVTPATQSLVDFLTSAIDEAPALYLGYLAFTEYVTALLGPSFLERVEERCGVSRGSMTVIDKHIELDRAHAEEGFAVIDDLVGDPRMLAPMRRALAGMLARYDALCVEVTSRPEVAVAQSAA